MTLPFYKPISTISTSIRLILCKIINPYKRKGNPRISIGSVFNKNKNKIKTQSAKNTKKNKDGLTVVEKDEPGFGT